MMIYNISKQAAIDLENIWLYTLKNWSLEQADYHLGLIFEEIKYISQNPKMGEDYSHLRKGYFRARIKSHYIFYKIDIKNKEVLIVRILHQQMDIKSKF